MLKLFNRKKKDNKGFTLVELVIVIAILAILVGLLAPQYTRYVEKSRKSADANNMNELVKVVQVYAGDAVNELAKGDYTITISDGKTGTTGITDNAPKALKDEMDAAVPDWKKLTTKSKKWNNGATSAITAKINVNEEGGIKVTYTPGDFNTYMGVEDATPAPGDGGSQQGGSDNTQ